MMQACGPVVRPHEILQTLIISIPQPSAAVKSFFERSRNFGAPFSLYPQQRVYLRRYSGAPLEARLALPGGGMFAMTWRGIAAVWRRRVPGSPGGDKRGQGNKASHKLKDARNRAPVTPV